MSQHNPLDAARQPPPLSPRAHTPVNTQPNPMFRSHLDHALVPAPTPTSAPQSANHVNNFNRSSQACPCLRDRMAAIAHLLGAHG
eukprot:9389079-Pyramimonas_sp.AAC.1